MTLVPLHMDPAVVTLIPAHLDLDPAVVTLILDHLGLDRAVVILIPDLLGLDQAAPWSPAPICNPAPTLSH